MLSKVSKFLIVTSLVLFGAMGVSGCTDSSQANFEQHFNQTKSVLTQIDSQMKILKDHVEKESKKGKYEITMRLALNTVGKKFPDDENVKELTKTFLNDTTEKGTIYKKMLSQYQELQRMPEYNVMKNKTGSSVKHSSFNSTFFNELYNAKDALTIQVFDEHFIDYINILSSVSGGAVSPVEVESVSKTAPIGSQLVGNPDYGKWVTDPQTGHQSWSFLETYAMLSIMDSMFDSDRGYSRGYHNGYNSGSRYRYDSWSKTRNWSYSNDAYRTRYSSPSQKATYAKYQTSLAKNPNYKNKSFSNPTLKKQTTKLNAKASKYSPSIVNKSKVASLNRAQPTRTRSYSSRMSSSSSHRGTSSSPSRRGGK